MSDRVSPTLTTLTTAAAMLAAMTVAGCSASRPTETADQSEMTHEVLLTPETFDSIVRSEKAALIDFSADWCAPCQQMKPEVAQIADEMQDELVVAVADMTDNDDAPAAPVAVAWNVEGYPTFILVRNGEELARTSGSMRAGKLTSWVRENL